ncbi:MAG: DUF2927 domain-containing protein [Pseudomonadota bacterium]
MRAAFALLLALAACGSVAGSGRDAPLTPASLPSAPESGGAIPAGHTAYSNRSLAGLFVALTHDLEWGARRPHLVRYEAPVNVAVEGPGSASYTRFIDLYLAELRTRSEIQISRGPGPANLHIRFVEGARFDQTFPGISCLVALGNQDWESFRRDPNRLGGRGLETGTAQTQTTIFIPQTAAPYRVRGCLLEEIAQALGPANDLYGLGPSIFNDDAAHLWPTKLDYLMLRTLYHPNMRTGMSRQVTESAAFRVLEEINSQGRDVPPIRWATPRALRGWQASHQEIYSKRTSRSEQIAKAQKARRLAARKAPGSAQHCHSLRTLGRVLARQAPADALDVLREAADICTRVHGPEDIRLSLIALERAIALSRQGSARLVIQEMTAHEAKLAAYGHEERLAALYNLRANAYLAQQQGAKSFADRRLARDWAAYAYGRDSEILARMTEIERVQ